MARFGRLLSRRAGPIGLVLTTWEIWRRLPPEYRRQIIRATRKHGPRVAAELRRLQRERAKKSR
jgi:hypothetical protein